MQSQPIPSFLENGEDEICLRACSTGTGRLEAARERNVLKKGWMTLLSFRVLPISIHQRLSYLYRYIYDTFYLTLIMYT